MQGSKLFVSLSDSRLKVFVSPSESSDEDLAEFETFGSQCSKVLKLVSQSEKGLKLLVHCKLKETEYMYLTDNISPLPQHTT